MTRLFMVNVNPSKQLMKKINYFILALIAIMSLYGCKEAELKLYEQDANIYFDLNRDDRDSIVYTFAYDMTKAVDTVYLPVRITGHRLPQGSTYKAYVEQDSSTAVPELHYKPLEDNYSIVANSGRAWLPLILYNVSDLEERSVSVILKLQGTEDFGVENPNIIRARVILSARLEKPHWWDQWLGDYSRAKHQLFILVTGLDYMTNTDEDPFGVPKNTYIASVLTMMLNDPFRWVNNNPEKGYVLNTEDNGATYSFYHKDNPSRPMLLRYNAGSGKYFFIDENGREVR
ncbi:DUF4843 domain-containing protein [Sphingobacterium alkalisoli]|uniref:DUF4843 domain-containing protein n=2 Tax=Sphingobacterium alkalisoli TaxID=1874115 RepID=A0A4U0GY31_9SPHI|nr:DUF4843 domain-containing protein [Sphingobacterium alkalisoli]